MEEKYVQLSLLLVLAAAVGCLALDHNTWSSPWSQHSLQREDRFTNDDEDISSGSGSGTSPPPLPPLPIPAERFASGPFLPLPQCADITEEQVPLPTQDLEQLQWHAMCQLACITREDYDVSEDGLEDFFDNDITPVWKIVSTDYLTDTCATYNRLKLCTRGCVIQRERRIHGRTCSDQCISDCSDDCPTIFCSNRICFTSCSSVVGACQTGCLNEVCNEVINKLKLMYPLMVEPSEPPVLTRDILRNGVFHIGQVRSPRTVQVFEGSITALLFRVIDIDDPASVSYHLPIAMDAPVKELDLSAWTCKSVEVSFQAVSFGLGVSSFSPPITLEVLPAVPPPPRMLTAVRQGPTRFLFSWTPPVDAVGILGYSVFCVPTVGGIDNYTTDVMATSVVAEGFENGVVYICTVSASSEVGLSLPSNIANITTDEAEPTGSPQNFVVVLEGQQEVSFSWNPLPPKDRNGDIISYTITCSAESGSRDITVMTLTGVLNGLRPNTLYSCSIVAHNSIGTGPPATVTAMTDIGPPSGPPLAFSHELVPGDHLTVVFRWQPPSPGQRNGDIIRYTLECVPANEATKLTEVVIVEPSSEELSARLEPFIGVTQYNCTVSASTVAGNGPKAHNIVITAQSDLTVSIDEPFAPVPNNVVLQVPDSEPRDISLVPGRTYLIHCWSGDGFFGRMDIWKNGNGNVVPTPELAPTGSAVFSAVIGSDNNRWTLVVQEFDSSLGGIYICDRQDISASINIGESSVTAIPGVFNFELTNGDVLTSRPILHVFLSPAPSNSISIIEQLTWTFMGSPSLPLGAIAFGYELFLPTFVSTGLAGTYTAIYDSPTFGVVIANFTVIVRTQPAVVIEPRAPEVRAGDSLTITCTDTQGYPLPTFFWSKGEVLLINDTRVTIVSYRGHNFSRSSLTIDPVVPPGDVGEYTCLAVGGENLHSNGNSTVTVFYAPILDHGSPPNITKIEGSTVVLAAVLIGAHPPVDDIVWRKGDSVIDTSQGKYSLSPDQYTLTIADAVPEDGGSYFIEAKNDEPGERRIMFRVEIIVFVQCPSFPSTDCVTTINVMEGIVVFLHGEVTCLQCGDTPVAGTMWTFNFAPLGDEYGTVLANGQQVIYDPRCGLEQIHPITIRCISPRGLTSIGIGGVYVIVPPIVPKAVTVNEGEDIDITCDFSNSNGLFVSAVHWKDSSCTVIQIGARLQRSGIDRAFAGVYFCIVEFVEGIEVNSSTTVIVQYPFRDIDCGPLECGRDEVLFVPDGECCPICQTICNLDADVENCSSGERAFFFNRETGECERFTYSGCGGNQNRFSTIGECRYTCNLCLLPPEMGPCKDFIPSFFFNSSSEQCESFVYGGCNGNANRFSSITECEGVCGGGVCPPTCSKQFCDHNRRAICSNPGPQQLPGCTGPCQLTYCSACYYSEEALPTPDVEQDLPQRCQGITDYIEDERCLLLWANEVRRAHRRMRGPPPRKDSELFKCFSPDC